MKEFKKVLQLILNDDWHNLLMYLTMDEIDVGGIKTSSEDYKWEGDYEMDAKHTYPNRDNLIKAVIKKALNATKNTWDGMAPEDIIRMKVEDEGYGVEGKSNK